MHIACNFFPLTCNNGEVDQITWTCGILKQGIDDS
jgi:hypothetical protein